MTPEDLFQGYKNYLIPRWTYFFLVDKLVSYGI